MELKTLFWGGSLGLDGQTPDLGWHLARMGWYHQDGEGGERAVGGDDGSLLNRLGVRCCGVSRLLSLSVVSSLLFFLSTKHQRIPSIIPSIQPSPQPAYSCHKTKAGGQPKAAVYGSSSLSRGEVGRGLFPLPQRAYQSFHPSKSPSFLLAGSPTAKENKIISVISGR